MSRINILLLAAALLGVSVLSACGGSSARPEYEYADNKAVKIERIDKRAIEGDFLEISITFRNKSKGDENNSKYRVDWFDANGFIIEQSSWRPLRVKGGAAMYARERSTIPGAREFTVVISNKD